MKRFVWKAISLIVALTIITGVVSACDWITVNTERDLGQVVASVRIDDKVESEDILKKDLKSRFMSYEYQYVYYYGYTAAQAYELSLKYLVQSKVITQKARLELADVYNKALKTADGELDAFTLYFKANALAGGKDIDPAKNDVKVGSSDAYALTQYLTPYELKKAYYSVRKSINGMIDSFEDKEEENESYETVTYTDRTAPEAEDHSELDEADLKTTAPTFHERLDASVVLGDEAYDESIDNLYDLDVMTFDALKIDISSSPARRKAYNSLLSSLKKQGLISETEKYDHTDSVDNIINYSYFKDVLVSQIESIVVSKYQRSLVTSMEEKLGDDAVWAQYVIDYEAQKAKFKKDYSAYETALDAASETAPVLYNPYENYGYVSNILIPFTDEQTTALNEKKNENNVTDDEIKAFRKDLAKGIDAYDQRSSWVLSSHGKYVGDSKFEFEDAYVVDGKNDDVNAALKGFVGSVTVKDAEGYFVENDEGAKVRKWQYSEVTPTAVKFADFVTDYLEKIGLGDVIFDEDDPATVAFMAGYDGAATVDVISDEDFASIRQLTFAFSSDPGILSKAYGYLYSPFTSADKYVSEFAAAAKAIVEKGVGAYTVVLTDYGYHVMVCTKVVKDSYGIGDKARFISDLADENSQAYKYRKIKYDALTENEISKFVNTFIGEVTAEDSGAIVYYEDNYKDLVTETTAD